MRASGLLSPTTSPTLDGVNQEIWPPHDDDLSDHGAGEATESEMAIAPETDDTPSVSAPEQSPDPPPAKSQSHAMEVDDEQGDPPPASPISPVDDDLLTGRGMADIEGDLANLTVSSPKNLDGSGLDASAWKAPVYLPFWEALPASASRMSPGRE